jgi:DNA-binding LacI/PurR family transcriptional regulator
MKPIQKGLALLKKKVPIAGFSEWEAERMQKMFQEQEIRSIAGRYMAPLFMAALGCSTATAWVGANDGVAWMALSFLRSKGVAVPQQISVMGFDDELGTALNQLTSYNFNRQGCVRRMIDYVLHPGLSVSFRNTNITDVEGYIVERRTTAKARH